MLGKLMKYEFKATGRTFLPLFAALLVLAVVNRLLSYLQASAPSVIGIIVSVILVVGIFVVALVITLQRFWKNLLSNEGYLMMTLPMKKDSLILSKLFVSAIWQIASCLIVTVAIMIMAMTSFSFSDLANFIREAHEYIGAEPIQYAIIIIEFVVVAIVSIFSGTLTMYAAMSLSMLVNKHRALFAFGMYMAISTALQIIYTIIGVILVAAGFMGIINGLIERMSLFGQIQAVVLIVFVLFAALNAVLYLLTRYMLDKRLNLQ